MMSAQNVQRKGKEKRSCRLSSLLRQRKYKTDSSKKTTGILGPHILACKGQNRNR